MWTRDHRQGSLLSPTNSELTGLGMWPPYSGEPCLELGCAAESAGSAVRVHHDAAQRVGPQALQGRHGFGDVVSNLTDGTGRVAARFVPPVEGIGGGLPKSERRYRVLEAWIVLFQTQVFGPEFAPKCVR